MSDDWKLEENILVTIRTPATMAAYQPLHNRLFDALVERLCSLPRVTPIMLPRSSEQFNLYRSMFPNLIIPENPLPGEQLVHFSDYVISGGGTMNREAAILGTPVYSVFAGRLPSVDQSLVELGRMKIITSLEDVAEIEFFKNPHGQVLGNP